MGGTSSREPERKCRKAGLEQITAGDALCLQLALLHLSRGASGKMTRGWSRVDLLAGSRLGGRGIFTPEIREAEIMAEMTVLFCGGIW